MKSFHILSRKEYYLHVSEFKFYLPSVHEYSLLLRRGSAEGALTLLKRFIIFAAVLKLGKTDLDQELQ